MSFKSFSSAQAAPTKDNPKDKDAPANDPQPQKPDKAPDKDASPSKT